MRPNFCHNPTASEAGQKCSGGMSWRMRKRSPRCRHASKYEPRTRARLPHSSALAMMPPSAPEKG
eukprot:CAMPEP_0185910614 /NCGR_PEP_ID=MMETSP0196C-20130402/20676_1 /TAXON_ID=2932 /ORGANISM="Alexandrium fundyense, Strain CCMP1719" /LENGTH=64 /DNA_ID=CAMNT_0028631405 /DNA_START=78 /DNA_END=269 /DNA_ORIENTATION=+